MKTKSAPTGETREHEGTTIAEYTDGSWRYNGSDGRTKGAIAIRSPAWKDAMLNTEKALAANEIKRSIRQEDAAIGVMRAAESMSTRKIKTSHEGMQFIYERQAVLGMSPREPGSTAAAKFVEQAHYGGTQQDTPRVLIHIDNATLNAIQQVEERNVIEGDFVEQD